jgi:AraC family transcriptional regulator
MTHLAGVSSHNRIVDRAEPLSRRCPIEASATLDEANLFLTSRIAIGAFRCPVAYPSFRDTGPIDRCIVVFPRTAVWIRHEGSQPFLADPTVVTIYNRAQCYERFPSSPEGDQCDWFAVCDDLAGEIVSAHDRSAGESDRPFKFEWAPSSGALYLRQRALLRHAAAGLVESLEAEEEVVSIVDAVVGSAYARDARPRARGWRGSGTTARHRRLVDAARAELLRTCTENRSVHELAAVVGASPFHLCRVFRAVTGRTMHEHRSELRVRMALELLEGRARNSSTLAAVAHAVGFSSHAHLVTAMRRHVGTTPSAARALVVTPTPLA